MTKLILPVLPEAITRQPQDTRGQVRPFTSGREDKKTTVLNQEVSTLGELTRAPAKQALTELEVQSGRGERQQGHPLASVAGHIPQDLANGRGVAQIVLALHVKVVSVSLFRGEELDGDLFKEAILGR